jgi:hypothetical protein
MGFDGHSDQRVKAFAAEREISLAEIARRGIEQFMARFPENAPKRKKWRLPRVNGGGIKVPLAELHALARRRAYDWRAALSMLRQGVTEFATVNVKDFEGFGFARVWNPLKP